MKIQVVWKNPYIISIKQFMSNQECNEITNGLGQKLEGFVEYAIDEDAEVTAKIIIKAEIFDFLFNGFGCNRVAVCDQVFAFFHNEFEQAHKCFSLCVLQR